jgi:photosystem II stability/assembly factor-like uncharacterized protein
MSARGQRGLRPEPTAARQGDSFGVEEDESESIRERILDYLERHGDNGRIDPEGQRRRVAAEYQRYRKEAAVRARSRPLIGNPSDWISLGPDNGAGRMTAIAPVPGAPNTVYAGAAGGGVWKTTDGGASWVPLTEGLHDLSVGALAVAPSNPSVVYVGSGEAGGSASFIPGIGLLKSTDGGATWILPDSVLATAFYRILVHPSDANELVAGTSAGGFRSTDGGATWTNVISHADYGEISDMVRDSTDPRILYAVTYCPLVQCTFRSAHVLRSADGGLTWSDRSSGLPSSGVSRDERTSIAIAQSSPQILYAARGVRDLVVTGDLFSHIYKTTDAGLTWTDLASVSGDPHNSHYMGTQSSYDNVIVVSPTDPNVVFAGGISYLRSTDGGASFGTAFTSTPIHVDCHDLRYIGSRLWIANDGGIATSDDGTTAVARNGGLVTRQFYSLANDPTNRARILAGSQDNGSMQRLDPGTAWRTVGGGDGIQCAIHPLSPEIAWITIQTAQIRRTRAAGSSVTPSFENVTPPFEPDERIPFYSVARLDPREPNTLYSTSYRLWKSRDGGDTWRPLPTTTTDGSVWSASVTIPAVALPAGDSPLVLVAKGNGVFRSADSGQTWTSGRGLPNSVVTNVEIDPRDPSTAYACIATTTGPSLFRSGDGGQTWSPSADGLPSFSAQVLRIDPTDSNDLFCGTDVGVFRSTNRGATWTRFGTGLPSSSIHDVQILEDGSLLRVATYGRGIWELVIPPTGNTAPSAAIASPAGPISVLVGVPVEFLGGVSDPDAGDTATGSWFFPDDATSVPLPFGGASVRHTFWRGGIFPVALSARDSHGARGSAIVMVSVREESDACAAPAVIPGAGPFPYTLAWNDEAGTMESTDPQPSCFPGGGRSGSTWFEFTPAVAAGYTFSTCTDVNTVISIFTGGACGPYTALPLSCPTIGGPGSDCGIGTTSVTASVAAGQTLRILLGGIVDSNVGRVRLTVVPAGSSSDAPRVDRVGDSQGPAAGGTLVVIAGRGFGDGATVSFGGAPATEVAVLASGVLSARAPPHAPGAVDVSVTIPGAGTATLGSAFRYDALESADRAEPKPPPKAPPSRIVKPR